MHGLLLAIVTFKVLSLL